MDIDKGEWTVRKLNNDLLASLVSRVTLREAVETMENYKKRVNVRKMLEQARVYGIPLCRKGFKKKWERWRIDKRFDKLEECYKIFIRNFIYRPLSAERFWMWGDCDIEGIYWRQEEACRIMYDSVGDWRNLLLTPEQTLEYNSLPTVGYEEYCTALRNKLMLEMFGQAYLKKRREEKARERGPRRGFDMSEFWEA